MKKTKNNKNFDFFVNKFLKENLQMPQVSKGQTQQRPPSNISYQSYADIHNVGAQEQQKSQQQAATDEIEYDHEFHALMSTLPPDLQNTIKSSQNLSQMQSALAGVDATIRKQIEDYMVHKASAQPQQ